MVIMKLKLLCILILFEFIIFLLGKGDVFYVVNLFFFFILYYLYWEVIE